MVLFMPNEFRSLKEIINKDPGLAQVRKIIKENEIEEDFEKIFPELRKFVSKIKKNKNTLVLKVENSAWRNELKFREQEIIKKINDFYQEERINQIRFTTK